MPLQETSGNLTTDAYGGGAAVVANYIEDVFSTYLYTGNGSTQTITNGIDLSTKGGLVWIKGRNAVEGHTLFDTARGVNQLLQTQNTDGSANFNNSLTAFNTNGFTLGTNRTDSSVNYVSWTFREQPKFFDIVTYTGTGSNTTIAHSLGSVPGSIIVKRTDTTGAWQVYHQSLANTEYLVLNTTAAKATGATLWNSTTPTSSVFSLGTDATVNASGGTYVAYIFAHNAGGFGLTGSDNVISCGSLTGSGAGVSTTVTLGYEPQFILAKVTGSAQNWVMFDNMRGFDNTNAARLFPNLSNAESVSSASGYFTPTATGFKYGPDNYMGDTANIIYIAIRRGPMKVPTDATKVFKPLSRTGTGVDTVVNGVGFTPDLEISKVRNYAASGGFFDRLRGVLLRLRPDAVTAETTAAGTLTSFNMDGITVGADTGNKIINNAQNADEVYINWLFSRAPSFFDEVCYTGTGSATTFNHNLGIAPELIIVKKRNTASTTGWLVGATTTGYANKLYLNLTNASASDSTAWNSTAPTSTVFSVGTNTDSNASAATFVAYLFATCAGVSKVGSYTGNGTTQTINCGFGAGGARFVLIKRTDSTGDWYVYDTARGMTTLTDPYLLLNSTAAEAATLGSVTTVSTGFALNSTILAAINVNAGTYIFLAIA